MRIKTVEIKMPWLAPLEEPDIQVVEWLAAPGSRVEIDQDLAIMTVDGDEFILPSPLDGVITDVFVESGDPVATGQVLAILDWGE